MVPPLQTIPDPKTNNFWYVRPGADTVVVFIHGIHSDSRDCWLLQDRKRKLSVYWPQLISEDPLFQDVGIFMGGYHTAPDAGDFGLENCAQQLFDSLFAPLKHAQEPFLKTTRNVIFICHSTGGIVLRYILTRQKDFFKKMSVGIALMASPTKGSYYADVLKTVIHFYRSDLADTLRTESDELLSLHGEFLRMVESPAEHIPRLIGAEACEHHHIFRTGVHRLLGPRASWIPILLKTRIVDPEQAGCYWGPATMIPDTDHFTIVKPPDDSSVSHIFLKKLWLRFQHAQVEGFMHPPAPMQALPPRPQNPLIGRQAFLDALKDRLQPSSDLALWGEEEIGKSFLVKHLLHQQDIRDRYKAGILWGHLSEHKTFMTLLAEWGSAVGHTEATMLEMRRPQDRARAIANKIADRAMLLVLDGCTSTQDAETFRSIGSHASRLLVSRSQTLAEAFAGSDALCVEALSIESIDNQLAHAKSKLIRESQNVRARLYSLRNSTQSLMHMVQFFATASDAEAHTILQG